MGLAVTIITPGQLNLALAEEVLTEAVTITNKHMTVSGSWGYFAVHLDAVTASEFEPEELAIVTGLTPNPHFSSLWYRPAEAANVAIQRLDLPEASLIDNDHGAILTLADVRDHIRRGVPWQDGAV